MTWHDPSHTGTAIFVNKQNLAFALPLITLCAGYAYFNLVPVKIAWSFIAVGLVLYKVTSSMQARAIDKREEKISKMDNDFLRELAADELLQEEENKKAATRKKAQIESKVRKRIAAEKKMEKASGINNKKSDNGGGDEDEEEDVNDVGNLAAFVQKQSGKKKK